MEILENIINNKMENKNELIKTEEQSKFIETGLGQAINFGFDMGLRILLPDFIEQQIIDVKDILIKEGLKEGIKHIVSSAIDFGKSAVGIATGKFENMSQIQTVIKNGGIVDGVSDLTDMVLNKATQKGKIPYNISNAIKKGKDVILSNINNKLEDEFNNQLNTLEKLQKYMSSWKEYFNNHNFVGMQKEYEKIKDKINLLIPMEETLKEARTIENLHILIKRNNQNFNLTKEELMLAEMLN